MALPAIWASAELGIAETASAATSRASIPLLIHPNIFVSQSVPFFHAPNGRTRQYEEMPKILLAAATETVCFVRETMGEAR
jgi:hypothetical protein